MNHKVCIIGLGHVGIPLAVLFAEAGHHVVGVEENTVVATGLAAGRLPLRENGLSCRWVAQRERCAITVVTDLDNPQVADCTAFIVTVGTPVAADGGVDLSAVRRALAGLMAVMRDDCLLVMRATMPVGATRKIVGGEHRFRIAVCPERAQQGALLDESARVPQIVGGLDERSAQAARDLFSRVCGEVIVVSSLEAAEMVKMLDNAYRDAHFAFANLAALACESAGLRADEVIGAAVRGYARNHIARPGPVGGPCLTKDPLIWAQWLDERGDDGEFARQARRVNARVPSQTVALMANFLRDRPGPLRVGLCGLAFKGRPATDDVRGTAARAFVAALREAAPDARLVGHDFEVSHEVTVQMGLEPVSLDEAFDGSDLVLVITDHPGYAGLGLEQLLQRLAKPGLVVDMCGVLPRCTVPEDVRVTGFGAISATLADWPTPAPPPARG